MEAKNLIKDIKSLKKLGHINKNKYKTFQIDWIKYRSTTPV